jgi:hypothetical protein
MVSLLSLATFDETGGYHVILWRQDPQVCSGIVRAESRRTKTPLPARTKSNSISVNPRQKHKQPADATASISLLSAGTANQYAGFTQ